MSDWVFKAPLASVLRERLVQCIQSSSVIDPYKQKGVYVRPIQSRTSTSRDRSVKGHKSGKLWGRWAVSKKFLPASHPAAIQALPHQQSHLSIIITMWAAVCSGRRFIRQQDDTSTCSHVHKPSVILLFSTKHLALSVLTFCALVGYRCLSDFIYDWGHVRTNLEASTHRPSGPTWCNHLVTGTYTQRSDPKWPFISPSSDSQIFGDWGQRKATGQNSQHTANAKHLNGLFVPRKPKRSLCIAYIKRLKKKKKKKKTWDCKLIGIPTKINSILSLFSSLTCNKLW